MHLATCHGTQMNQWQTSTRNTQCVGSALHSSISQTGPKIQSRSSAKQSKPHIQSASSVLQTESHMQSGSSVICHTDGPFGQVTRSLQQPGEDGFCGTASASMYNNPSFRYNIPRAIVPNFQIEQATLGSGHPFTYVPAPTSESRHSLSHKVWRETVIRQPCAPKPGLLTAHHLLNCKSTKVGSRRTIKTCSVLSKQDSLQSPQQAQPPSNSLCHVQNPDSRQSGPLVQTSKMDQQPSTSAQAPLVQMRALCERLDHNKSNRQKRQTQFNGYCETTTHPQESTLKNWTVTGKTAQNGEQFAQTSSNYQRFHTSGRNMTTGTSSAAESHHSHLIKSKCGSNSQPSLSQNGHLVTSPILNDKPLTSPVTNGYPLTTDDTNGHHVTPQIDNCPPPSPANKASVLYPLVNSHPVTSCITTAHFVITPIANNQNLTHSTNNDIPSVQQALSSNQDTPKNPGLKVRLRRKSTNKHGGTEYHLSPVKQSSKFAKLDVHGPKKQSKLGGVDNPAKCLPPGVASSSQNASSLSTSLTLTTLLSNNESTAKQTESSDHPMALSHRAVAVVPPIPIIQTSASVSKHADDLSCLQEAVPCEKTQEVIDLSLSSEGRTTTHHSSRKNPSESDIPANGKAAELPESSSQDTTRSKADAFPEGTSVTDRSKIVPAHLTDLIHGEPAVTYTLAKIREKVVELEHVEEQQSKSNLIPHKFLATALIDLFFGGQIKNCNVATQQAVKNAILDAKKCNIAEDDIVFAAMKAHDFKELESHGYIQTDALEEDFGEYKSVWRNLSDESLDITKVLTEELCVMESVCDMAPQLVQYDSNSLCTYLPQSLRMKSPNNPAQSNPRPMLKSSFAQNIALTVNVKEKKHSPVKESLVRPSSPECQSLPPVKPPNDPACQSTNVLDVNGHCDNLTTTDAASMLNKIKAPEGAVAVHFEGENRTLKDNVSEGMSKTVVNASGETYMQEMDCGSPNNTFPGMSLTVLSVHETETLELQMIDQSCKNSSDKKSPCSPEIREASTGSVGDSQIADDSTLSMNIKVLTSEELIAATKALWQDKKMHCSHNSSPNLINNNKSGSENKKGKSIPTSTPSIEVEELPLFTSVEEIFKLDKRSTLSKTKVETKLSTVTDTLELDCAIIDLTDDLIWLEGEPTPIISRTEPKWPLENITKEDFAFNFLQLLPEKQEGPKQTTMSAVKGVSTRHSLKVRREKRPRGLDIQIPNSSPSGIKVTSPFLPSAAVKCKSPEKIRSDVSNGKKCIKLKLFGARKVDPTKPDKPKNYLTDCNRNSPSILKVLC